MNGTTALADLDELVLLCRDEKARLYIEEAVSCYRSGAYRSAIVATWIAVCYDIIDKLRELALAGDKEAEQQVAVIEKTRASNDFARALNFERHVLVLVRDKFELISHLEYIDLDRLQQDRNRCAHPSLISEDQGFNPPGELARLHIRSAVLHLLQHQPVQGKYALDRLLREVNSEYFPTDVGKAITSLSPGPLKRPRNSLVRNFVIVLLKNLLDLSLDRKIRRRMLAALGATKRLHHRIFEATLQDRLPALFRALPDRALILGVTLLTRFDDLWDIVPNDVQLKMERFVSDLPERHMDYIDLILNYPPLQQQAERRVRHASGRELENAFLFALPPIVVDRVVALYLEAESFADANECASHFIIGYASDFSAAQQRRILTGIENNNQVRLSNSLDGVITALRKTQILNTGEFESILETNGLQQYMLDQGEPAC